MSQEPLETTPPIVLHEADTPETERETTTEGAPTPAPPRVADPGE